MSSVIGEEKLLDNGDSSLSLSYTIDRMQEISALFASPNVCEPISACNSMQQKELGVYGQKEGDGQRKFRDVHEAKGEMYVVESRSHDEPICSNAVKSAVFSSVKHIKAEDRNEELLEIPVFDPKPPSAWKDTGILDLKEPAHPLEREVMDEGTIVQPCLLPHHPISEDLGWKEWRCPSQKRVSSVRDLSASAHLINRKVVDEGTSVQPCLQPPQPIPENLGWMEQRCPSRKRVPPVRDLPDGAHSIKREVVDEGTSEQPCLQPSHPVPENLGWMEQSCPSRKKVPPVRDLPDGAHSIKREVVDEGTSVQPCLQPPHPIPENLGWKEQSCPSQKRVSPVRDLPAGRGSKVPRLGVPQDKLLGQCGTDFNIHKAVVGEPIQQSVTIGKSGGVLEESLRSHEGACGRMMMQAPLFRKSSKIKGQEENLEDSNDEQGKGVKRSENSGKEITSPFKDKNKKKTSIKFSNSNMKLVEDSIAGVENERGLHGCVGRNKCICSTNKSDIRRKVRDTLRLFHGILRKLVQADETKTKGRVDSSIQLIAAAKILKDNGKYINTKKMIGHVPGVEVGDLFNYRLELTIIGLHRQIQRGIDFIKQDGKIVAISVVDSGRYENDMVNSNVLIYSGQGGNVAGGCKQLKDQKLEEGNLALKNSIDMKNLVRVIRGYKERKQFGGKRTTTATYMYDGLYTVERYWHEDGPHGKSIYKFELRRAPDQPELPRLPVKKVKKSKKSRRREGPSVDDVSKGKEKPPIYAVNTIDDEKPPPFTYITEVLYPDWCRPIPPKGCDCKDGCSDSKRCACAHKNGGEIPYNYSGAIVEEKSLVYECGPSCKCPPTCHNRVSQHGIKLPLEIFKTESRGWGVRSLSSITSGSFVCEYIGELLDDNEAERRIDNDEYLFDIGQTYNDLTLREGLSALIPDMPPSCGDVVENVGFTLDAAKYGNVGRFINHSCSPNLFAQNVLYDHEDKRIPHIMFFAAQNIPPLQELAYHYNYTIDQVFDSKGNIKKKDCHCGSTDCAGRMY